MKGGSGRSYGEERTVTMIKILYTCIKFFKSNLNYI